MFLVSKGYHDVKANFVIVPPGKHTNDDALQGKDTKHCGQIIIPGEMDKKPLSKHKNSHRCLSQIPCIKHFRAFCNLSHLCKSFFLKIFLPP